MIFIKANAPQNKPHASTNIKEFKNKKELKIVKGTPNIHKT